MSPGWPLLRRAILARDLYVCRLCGAPAITVDHITPRAWGGSDEPANLRSLCGPCHARVTAEQSLAGRKAGSS